MSTARAKTPAGHNRADREKALASQYGDIHARKLQRVVGLKVHPELSRRAQITRQAQRHVGRDRAAFVDDFGHPRHGHAQITGDAIDIEPKLDHEALAQHLARVNRFFL